jgi:7,8-dihydropterin-6-yl-methyl-4-(beta-D-ribofuranosyl)aminobenzene 5'-phosphate synthase
MPTGGGDEKPVFVGMPWPKAFLATRGARFEWREEFSEVAPNVFITGVVPRKTLFELGSPKLIVSSEGGWTPDPFLDDMSMVVKTSRGLVIVLGCAHAGVINILRHASERTGEKRIYAVLGGTHLGMSPDPQLDPTIEALREFDIKVLGVSHCTGQGPAARLSSEFRKGFAFARVGFVLEV